MSVYLQDDKVLLNGGKVATDAACCCGCSFSITFEFKIDSSEYVSGSFGGKLFDSSTMRLQPFYDATVVTFYLNSFDALDISTTDFFDVWHTFTITITEKVDHSGWDSIADIDGTPFTGNDDLSALDVAVSQIAFGSLSADNFSHRSIRNISTTIARQTFNFPTDSFDSFVGGASIVGDELRIDQADSADSYGGKDFDRDMSFCCSRDCSEISSITVSGSGSVSFTGAGCSVSFSNSLSGLTWNRINHDETFDVSLRQFKLYFRTPTGPEFNATDRCVLVFDASGPTPEFGRLLENDYFPTVCTSGSCTYSSGSGLISAFEVASLSDFLITYDSGDSGDGSITLTLEARVSASCFEPTCSTTCGGCDSGFATDSSVVPYTQSDVSGLIGSYSASFTDTVSCGAGNSTSDSVNIVIA